MGKLTYQNQNSWFGHLIWFGPSIRRFWVWPLSLPSGNLLHSHGSHVIYIYRWFTCKNVFFHSKPLNYLRVYAISLFSLTFPSKIHWTSEKKHLQTVPSNGEIPRRSRRAGTTRCVYARSKAVAWAMAALAASASESPSRAPRRAREFSVGFVFDSWYVFGFFVELFWSLEFLLFDFRIFLYFSY